MLQLKNNTPFAAHYLLLPNAQGVDTLYVNLKASFNLGKHWTLCDEQADPLHEDVYWGEPGQSSLKFPTDIHPGKPGTDIAILASAWAPNHKPVRQLDVTASVGPRQKTLRVFAERVWHRGSIIPTAEFVQLPIRYEQAFGGQYWDNNTLVDLEPRNPLGKGYKGSRSAAAMEGMALPNIENPAQLISAMEDQPEPAGFGFIAANWYPRAHLAGTYDEHWQRHRAPYLPLDYQSRFQNSAHPDLVTDSYLTGGETVALTNMHPAGPINFFLPRVNLAGSVQISGRPAEALQFLMETVIIDVDAGKLQIVWKASWLCNNAFARIRAIHIHLLRR